jgi:hypothetical protein
MKHTSEKELVPLPQAIILASIVKLDPEVTLARLKFFQVVRIYLYTHREKKDSQRCQVHRGLAEKPRVPDRARILQKTRHQPCCGNLSHPPHLRPKKGLPGGSKKTRRQTAIHFRPSQTQVPIFPRHFPPRPNHPRKHNPTLRPLHILPRKGPNNQHKQDPKVSPIDPTQPDPKKPKKPKKRARINHNGH